MRTSKTLIMLASFFAGITFVYSCGGGGGSGSGGNGTTNNGSSANAAVVQVEPTQIFFDSVNIIANDDLFDYRPASVGSNPFMITDIITRNTTTYNGQVNIHIKDSSGNILNSLYLNMSAFTVSPSSHYALNGGIPVPADATIDMEISANADISISGYTY